MLIIFLTRTIVTCHACFHCEMTYLLYVNVQAVSQNAVYAILGFLTSQPFNHIINVCPILWIYIRRMCRGALA